MHLGLIGLPKSGKTTLFNLLTASRQRTDKFAVASSANVGSSLVPDARLEALRRLFQPRRYTPATVQYLDLPGLEQGRGGADLDLAGVREADALVHVVRCFSDPEILHPRGAVDPAGDVVGVDLELVLADHSLVERRLERLDRSSKRGLNPEELAERALLADVVMPSLEAERPLRDLELGTEERRRLRGFQLLSAKPMLTVFNVDEAEASRDKSAELALDGIASLTVSAPIEEEISRLEPEEQREFLAELGLAEPALARVIRASYTLLGLLSFFTVGEDEVRAWTVPRGATARQAAGAIHSDIARGFIRAEVVPWADLVDLRSLPACREAGRLRLEGKEYVVKDGDVVHFRFNV